MIFSFGPSKVVFGVSVLPDIVVLIDDIDELVFVCARVPGPVVWAEVVLLNRGSAEFWAFCVTVVTAPRPFCFITGSSFVLSRTRRSIGIG